MKCTIETPGIWSIEVSSASTVLDGSYTELDATDELLTIVGWFSHLGSCIVNDKTALEVSKLASKARAAYARLKRLWGIANFYYI